MPFLKQRKAVVTDSRLTPGTTALLGADISLELDKTFPLEEVRVSVMMTCHGTPPSSFLVDSLAKILKRATLTVQAGVGAQPRVAVDYSGIGLLEYCLHTGANLPPCNFEVLSTAAGIAATASATYRVTYRIPLVHPMVDEPLRTWMLLPVHTYDQKPTLRLQFSTAAEMYAAGSLTLVAADVSLVRREMSVELTKSIQAKGGFVPFDLIETPFTIPLGSTAEQRLAIPVPGAYAGLLMRHYLGGAALSRADISGSTTLGAETIWKIESGKVVIDEWRCRHLADQNGETFCATRGLAANFPHFAALAANTAYPQPVSLYLDKLSDGTGPVHELGSLLDCNLPANLGLAMEIIFTPSSTATYPSQLHIGGHRYFGDLSRWQALPNA